MRKLYNYNTDDYAFETPQSYYFLGLIASDGVIDGYHVKIGMKDKDLIEALRDDIVPGKPLYYDSRCDTWYLKISCKAIMDFVLQSGITAKKSLTLEIKQEIMDSRHFSHFIRGYFDGDGTIGITRSTNGKSTKNYYRPCIRIGSASRKIVEQIQQILTKAYGFNDNKIVCHNNYYVLKYTGNPARKFYNVIYKEAGIKLNRKHKRYAAILSLDNAELGQYYGNGKEGMAEIDKLAL